MKCFRTYGAHVFKLIKKNNKIITIILFFVFMMRVFHMSQHKRRTKPGDLIYKARYFLKDEQPNEKISFCKFNYGLPDELELDDIRKYMPPELGENSPYRVIYNAVNGTAYSGVKKQNSVTYVTETTPEYIYHIVGIARHWEGPISLAIFVPDYDLAITMQILKHLCSCYVGMSKVSVHLFYPKNKPPSLLVKESLKLPDDDTSNIYSKEDKHSKKASTPSAVNESTLTLFFQDCYNVESLSISTYRIRHKISYPINVGRNVARYASPTNYFLVSDIELVPSTGLASGFVAMVRNTMENKLRDSGYVFPVTIFPVPAFELLIGDEMPLDKNTLLKMIKDHRIQYYQMTTCTECHLFPEYEVWLKTRPGKLTPFTASRRKYPFHHWEPVYFGTNEDPWFSEILSWEGLNDKTTQMLEFCLLNYTMVILDGGFLCHAASDARQRHLKAEKENRKNYISIVRGLKSTYGDEPACRLTDGL